MKKRILAMLLACVMLALAIPAVLPVTAAEETLYADTFDEATEVEFSRDTREIPEPTDIPFLFVWYDASGNPLPKSTTVTDDCYAVYNPVLIEEGVFSADEDFYVILEKYRAHLEEYGQLTFNGDWSVVNLRYDGTRLGQINELTRVFINNRGNLYGLFRDGTTAPCWDQNWIFPKQVRTDWEKQMFETFLPSYVDPGSDGKIFFSEIKYTYASTVLPAFQSQHSELGSGAQTIDGVVYAVPSPKSSTAYLYTVPENVKGEAYLTIDSISASKFAVYSNPGKICMVLINAEGCQAVWPAGADFATLSSWADINPLDPTTADTLNATLKDVKMNLLPGDKVALCVGRPGSTIAVNIKPTIHVDKEMVVTFQDKDGNVLSSGMGKVGAAFPKAPYAADEAGYLIDGVAAAELPETITKDMTVQYAGDVVVEDAVIDSVGVAVASNFGLNVFLEADPYATKVGILNDEGEEVWAELQADGKYKLVLPNLNAKDMDQTVTILTVQEFADGRQYDAAFEEEIVPTEVLASYADSDATDAEKALAVAALDYVAAAKAYFYGDALEDAVKARLAAQDAAIAAIESNVALADKEEYTVTGVTLVLKDQVCLKVRVALSEMNFIDEEALDYLVAVEVSGSESEYEGFVYTEGDDELSMVMTLGGTAAADFDAVQKITVKDSTFIVSEIFKYSVNDYIARTFDANAKQADLLRAIYALGVAANNA